MTELWSQATGQAIGADWLAAAIAPASGYGRRARACERPFARGDEAEAREALERVARVARESTQAELHALGATVGRAPEISGTLARARSGATLDDVDFFELATFLGVLRDVCAQTAGRTVDMPALHVPEPLRAALAPGFARERSFYLDDAFDSALAAVRERARAEQASLDLVRSRAQIEVARELGRDALRAGEFTLVRELGSPLPANVRVEYESATASVCRLEPQAAEVSAVARRDAAVAAVAECEEGVRARLSAVVTLALRELDAAREALGELDALACRALFTQRHACVVPEIGDTATVELREMRYLPLAVELHAVGRAFAPLSFAINGVAVITGPNMGGKTAALRTLGFAAACVALGVPVPAAAARVPLVDAIAWLGADHAPEERALLSSFGAEVVAVRDVFSAAAPRPLVLVDEFARTTSAAEGRALTIAIVRAFVARHAVGLIATHFFGIAAAANVAHFTSGKLGSLARGRADSLDEALRRIAAAMDYGVSPAVAAGDIAGDALALAEALGLERTIVADARAALI